MLGSLQPLRAVAATDRASLHPHGVVVATGWVRMLIVASTRPACNEDDTRELYGYTMSPSGLRCLHRIGVAQRQFNPLM